MVFSIPVSLLILWRMTYSENIDFFSMEALQAYVILVVAFYFVFIFLLFILFLLGRGK